MSQSHTASAADTYPRQPGVDALHYVFRLTISDLNNEIAGKSTVTVRFTIRRDVKRWRSTWSRQPATKG